LAHANWLLSFAGNNTQGTQHCQHSEIYCVLEFNENENIKPEMNIASGGTARKIPTSHRTRTQKGEARSLALSLQFDRPTGTAASFLTLIATSVAYYAAGKLSLVTSRCET
jgi:hypothetical protein